ncbi:hypothetical protein EYF80_002760 [Liparis tanakae]|uniref:Synaptotagmin-7 n=1 Tax=Liparis tanakae TaxID=230148 RepID=A0A4Z2J9I3_9TELE|nr:hypothetical protein EYF80_002760 [Liparis tanakae]
MSTFNLGTTRSLLSSSVVLFSELIYTISATTHPSSVTLSVFLVSLAVTVCAVWLVALCGVCGWCQRKLLWMEGLLLTASCKGPEGLSAATEQAGLRHGDDVLAVGPRDGHHQPHPHAHEDVGLSGDAVRARLLLSLHQCIVPWGASFRAVKVGDMSDNRAKQRITWLGKRNKPGVETADTPDSARGRGEKKAINDLDRDFWNNNDSSTVQQRWSSYPPKEFVLNISPYAPYGDPRLTLNGAVSGGQKGAATGHGDDGGGPYRNDSVKSMVTEGVKAGRWQTVQGHMQSGGLRPSE